MPGSESDVCKVNIGTDHAIHAVPSRISKRLTMAIKTIVWHQYNLIIIPHVSTKLNIMLDIASGGLGVYQEVLLTCTYAAGMGCSSSGWDGYCVPLGWGDNRRSRVSRHLACLWRPTSHFLSILKFHKYRQISKKRGKIQSHIFWPYLIPGLFLGQASHNVDYITYRKRLWVHCCIAFYMIV